MFTELLLADLALYPIVFFLFGTIVGSFINAVEYRTVRNIPLFWGESAGERSKCPECEVVLGVRDLVPVLSYVVLRGRCRRCKKHISWQYPLVELVCGGLFVAVFHYFGWTIDAVVLAVMVSFLLTLFLTDFNYQLLPDIITIPAILAGVGALLIRGEPSIMSALLGVLIGGGFFALQYLLSKGKWIGSGDIRLGVLMGVLLGWQLTIVALFVAYIGGSLVALVLLALKRASAQSRIALGTFLTVATVVTLFVGQDLLDWYIGLL